MKVVIRTQVRENYGTAEAPYWKCKGGNTFVVPNLTPAQASKVKEKGIPTLKALIGASTPMFEEYVIGFDVVEDSATVCEPWETVTMLSWENGRWVAREETLNEEYGYMHKDIAKRSVYYEMAMGGVQENTKVMYTLRDGREMSYQETMNFLNKAA